MNAKSKEIIEELKGIVMDLHRSASQLDYAIQNIEELDGIKDMEFVSVSVKHHYNYRNDYKIHKQYHNIEERELDIWKRLIESLKEESQ